MKRKRITDEDIAGFVVAEKKTEDLLEAKAFLESLLRLRRAEKLYKTYINGTRRALDNTSNGRTYSEYRLDGTVTGRLSCGAYKPKIQCGVSFHTLPRETEINIRSMFIAPENHKFITVDYSGMELRVLAHVCNDKNMLMAFNSGDGDLHRYTASLLFKKSPENITKAERQLAKAVSFCIVYGGGAKKIASEANVSEEEAKKVLNNYMRIYPGIFTWMEEMQDFIFAHEYSVSLFKRRRNLPNVKSRVSYIKEESFRKGINFVIQSSASDILLFAILDISKEIENRNLRSEIVATVHDSIEFIAPDDEVDELIEIIKDKMINYPLMKETYDLNLKVPLAVEIEVGDSFGTGEEIAI